MKSATLVTLLLVTLASSAVAQRTRGTFLTNANGFDYQAGNTSGHIVFHVEKQTAPGQNSTVSFCLNVWNGITASGLDACGNVPLSVMKVTGKSITIDIPDLRDLVGPNFTLQYNGFADFSLHVSVTTTLSWQQKSTSTYTSRTPQPNGTIRFDKAVVDMVETSLAIEGSVVGWTMPVNDIFGATQDIYQRTVRNHTVQ